MYDYPATLEGTDGVAGLKVVSKRIVQPKHTAYSHPFPWRELCECAIGSSNKNSYLSALSSVNSSFRAPVCPQVLVLCRAQNAEQHEKQSTDSFTHSPTLLLIWLWMFVFDPV
jgi:hypothetical protein